jgi:hypothetical protein
MSAVANKASHDYYSFVLFNDINPFFTILFTYFYHCFYRAIGGLTRENLSLGFVTEQVAEMTGRSRRTTIKSLIKSKSQQIGRSLAPLGDNMNSNRKDVSYIIDTTSTQMGTKTKGQI